MSANKARSTGHILALPLGMIGIDLAVQTGASDPLNPVKFWILGILSTWVLSDLLTTSEMRNRVKTDLVVRCYFIILGLFTILIFVAAILTPVHSIGFLGDVGRNLGFLNYFFLALLAAYASLKTTFSNYKALYFSALFLLCILVIYATFQHFGMDFFSWNNPYNHIILLTGNPDFAASLLALLVTFSVLGLFILNSKIQKFFLIALASLALVDIYWTRALQGLLASAAGLGFFLIVTLWRRSRKFALSILTLEIAIGVLSILGTLQIGPLSKYLYKTSINDRGYNWRAAVSMFRTHPLFGVGVDRYGSFFAQYRDYKYPLIYGYTQTVTNAHNVFLEYFATAGVFVGLAYLAVIAFVGFRGFRALQTLSGNKKMVVAGFISGWIVFIAQSIISVDSLVISVWGWILGGSIVGLSIQRDSTLLTQSGNHLEGKRESKKVLRQRRFPARMGVFACLLISLLFIIVPMYRNETGTFRFSITQSPSDETGREIYRAIAEETFNHPLLNPNYKVDIANILAKNNYVDESINFYKQTLRADSRNINAYILISSLYERLNRPKESIPYRKQLALLDPYGAENLASLENDYLLTGDKTSAIHARDSILGMAPGTDVAKRAAGLISKYLLINHE